MRVSTESWPWRRKLSRCSCRNSNPRPFNHESCALTSELSRSHVSLNCEGQSHKTVSTDHNFWRERRAEADSNWGPSAYQPNALPLGQTGSLGMTQQTVCFFCVHRPPPRRKNKQTDSIFTDQFHSPIVNIQDMHADTPRSLGSLRYNRSPNSPYRLQHSFGISVSALSWFSSYFFNRTHAVTTTVCSLSILRSIMAFPRVLYWALCFSYSTSNFSLT